MTLAELQAKIEQGSYRSDRFPSVPFVTADMAANAASKPIKTTTTHTACGATLTTGDVVQRCAKVAGHIWMAGDEHDWAWSL